MQAFVAQQFETFWNSPNRNAWMKGIIIVSVLGLSALLAMKPSTRLFMGVTALIGGTIGLMALLRWPTLGLIGTLFGAAFVSYTGPGGINVAVISIAGLSALWIADMLILKRKISISDTRTTASIFVFIVCSLLSFGIGQFPWYPLAHHAPMMSQIGGLAIFIISAFGLFYTANTINSVRWLEILSWTFVAIGAGFVSTRFIPQLNQVIPLPYQPGFSSNAIFWLWLIIIPFSQALINKNLPLPVRTVLFAFVGLTLYLAIVRTSDWKSGYLPSIAGMATIFVLILRQRVFFVAPVFPALAYFLGVEALASDQYSFITRTDAWFIIIQLTAINPLFGLGFSNYYWYTHLKQILGWRVAFNSHSQYVDLFAQTGIVGMVAFFWVFWEVWNLGLTLRFRAPEGFARAYVYGALGGIVGTLVAGVLGDWILPFVYNVGMIGFRGSILSWIFLGGLIAIKQIIKTESK